jgi:hypothetical protein
MIGLALNPGMLPRLLLALLRHAHGPDDVRFQGTNGSSRPTAKVTRLTLRRHQTARAPHKSGVSPAPGMVGKRTDSLAGFSLQLLTTWVGLFLPLPLVLSGEAVVGVRAYCR